MKTEQKLFEDWLRDSFPSNHNFSNKGKDGQYINIVVQGAWIGWQASANREGYKLVPITPTDEMIVAIENKVQEQLDASAITADMFRLDGERIFEAMINATD